MSEQRLRETLEGLPIGELIDKYLELVYDNWKLQTRQAAVDRAINSIENKELILASLRASIEALDNFESALSIGAVRTNEDEGADEEED